MIEAAKQDAIKLAKQLVEMIDQLKEVGVADAILNDREFRKTVMALGVSDQTAKPATKGKRGKRKPMSAEARAKIAAAAKKRWAKVKKEGKTTL